MNLIKKIKKWINSPINYNKYMKLDYLNVNDLNENEYNLIREEFEQILKDKNIYISEEYKMLHLIKEINIFESCFPDYSYENKILLSECSSYKEYYEKCLDYYFKNLDKLKGNYFNFFSSYIRHLIKDKVSDRQIIRYLNGNIKFEEIKTYYEELEELNNKYSEEIYKYQIGSDSCGNPIYDVELFNNKK